MKLLVAVLFIAVACASINFATAIHCYVCNSGEKYNGTRCAHISSDGVGFEAFKKDCDNLDEDKGYVKKTYTLCRKFIQEVDGEERVVRSCATDGREDRCIDRTGTSDIKLTYCECRNDQPDQPCNSAIHYIDDGRLVALLLGATSWLLLSFLRS